MTNKKAFSRRSGCKQWLCFLIVGALLGVGPFVSAEPFQDAFRYGTYGVVAGALAGGTLLALSEDPGSSLVPVARGASVGLYAGLLVAAYQNWMIEGPSNELYIRPVYSEDKTGAAYYGLVYNRSW